MDDFWDLDHVTREAAKRRHAQSSGLFPALESPERREQTAKGVAKTGAIVTVISGAAAVTPGKAGRLLATGAAGTHKDPISGKVRPTKLTWLNLLPQPLGWTEPKVYGLDPHWWLPPGGGWPNKFLPDWVGFGFKEQRELDLQAERERVARNNAAAVAVLQQLNPATLREIAAGNILRAPSVEFRVAYGIAPQRIPFLARVALGERELANGSFVEALEEVFKSFATNAVKPTNRDAQGNEANAEGINKELITERADP